jgi:hypothetical protein
MTGIFLVVRRYSSLADALSHVALAGVSIGLLTHTQPVITTLIVTVAAAILIEYLRDQKKIFGESLLTIFLSAGLAITTLVMSRVASSTDTIFQLLFGSISTVSPQDVMITFILGLAVFFVFFVLYKELFFVSFDQDLAKSNGLRVRFYNVLLVNNGYMPTLFFLRFDRMKDVATPEFFANLEGIKTATHGQVSFVFTSFRNLDVLSPYAFPKASLQAFAHTMYLKPAAHEDVLVVYKTYKDRYDLSIPETLQQSLLGLVDGYGQYLHLSLIILQEKKDKVPVSKEALETVLLKDERIYLQSEELWESLTTDEQNVLQKVGKKESLSEGEKVLGKYLWDCGFILTGELVEKLM